jgi:hypothetical protein
MCADEAQAQIHTPRVILLWLQCSFQDHPAVLGQEVYQRARIPRAASFCTGCNVLGWV